MQQVVAGLGARAGWVALAVATVVVMELLRVLDGQCSAQWHRPQ